MPDGAVLVTERWVSVPTSNIATKGKTRRVTGRTILKRLRAMEVSAKRGIGAVGELPVAVDIGPMDKLTVATPGRGRPSASAGTR